MAKSETIWTMGIREFNLVHRHARVPTEPNALIDPDAICTLELHQNIPGSSAKSELCRWDLKTPQRTRMAINLAAQTIRILTENMRGNGIDREKFAVNSPPITIEGHTYRVSMDRLMKSLFVVQLDKDRRAFQWEFETAENAAAAYAICRGIVQAYAHIKEPVNEAEKEADHGD